MTIERIIDANANRAREALRVLEESARFILDDAELAASVKSLRHDLSAALEAFGACGLHRDVAGDVGTRVSTPRERMRATAADVVAAAGRRLGEALRAIEEYGKTIDAGAAACIERLRYDGYAVAARIERRFAAGRSRQWRVCVLLGEDGGGRDWADLAGSIVAAQPDCIQLRLKTLDDRERLRRARFLVDAAGAGTAIVINDRPDIALLAGVHGLHLGQTDLPVHEARKIVGRRLLIGVSTSRLEEARAAQADGADYCGVGPMFPSSTKHKDLIVGPDYLREYVAWEGLPHLAIGGITPENVDRILAAGGRGIAVSAAVCDAADPGAVVRELTERLDRAHLTTMNHDNVPR